jgi:hypothetical protein
VLSRRQLCQSARSSRGSIPPSRGELVKASGNGRLEHSAIGHWRSLAPDPDSVQSEKRRRRYRRRAGYISMQHTYNIYLKRVVESDQFPLDRALHRTRGEGTGCFITQAADMIRVLTTARHAGEQLLYQATELILFLRTQQCERAAHD